jgi:hypothetical protein
MQRNMASYFHCKEEMKMTDSLWIFERRARYLMSVITLLLVLALLLFKTGLVSTAPSYKDQAWYSVSEQAGFVVTTEYADEAECRSSEKSSSTACWSGKYLAANESKDHSDKHPFTSGSAH